MSATAIWIMLWLLLVFLSAITVCAVCLIGRAARPLRRGSRAFSVPHEWVAPATSSPYPARSSTVSRTGQRRSEVLRRSVHAPWRE